MEAISAPLSKLNATGLLQAAAGCLGLAALATIGWLALAPPEAPPPSVEIAARAWQARTQAHIDALSTAPRPIATRENAQARRYLMAQLQAMGLQPEVQRAKVRKSVVHFFGNAHTTIGVVHNVVARIPGGGPDAARRPALLLATHYDSGSAMADATKGAATTAALLETARLLRTASGKSAARNDIVLLFADGEQVGALGAQGFAEQHRFAGDIGLALKFDGTGGDTMTMAGASAAGAALGGWMRAAPDVRGSSLEASLARMRYDLPRVGALAALDAPVLLFAGGEAGTTRLGDAMLRLARTYGDMPLARGMQTPHAYFSLPLVGPVHHPAWLAWVLAGLSCLMLARAWRSLFGQDGATEAAQGVFGIGFLLLATRIGTWNWRYEIEAAGVAGEDRLPLVVAAVTACCFMAGLYLLRRAVSASATVLGALAWVTLALMPVIWFLPGAAHVLAWPLAAALGAVLILHTRWGERQAFPVRLLVLLAALVPAVALLAPALRDTWRLLAPVRLYLPPMLLAMLVLCFASLPLMLRLGSAVASVLAVVTAACFALPGQAANDGIQPPAPDAVERLVYYKDVGTWRAYWLLPDGPLDDWSRQLFAGRTEPTIFVEVFGWGSPRQWYSEAPREDAVAFPESFVLRNHVGEGSVGKVRLGEFTVRSKNRAPRLELYMLGAKALRSRLDGVQITSREAAWSLSLYGMEDQVLRFEIESKPDDIFAIAVREHLPGLPRHLLPARAPGAPPLPPQSGKTVSTDILRFY